MTARISDHARERAAEMGIRTKEIKHLLAGPHLRYPAHGGRWHARGSGFTVVYVDHPDDGGTPIVVTVLFNHEFTRGGSTCNNR